jgi:hypothetical protein
MNRALTMSIAALVEERMITEGLRMFLQVEKAVEDIVDKVVQ